MFFHKKHILQHERTFHLLMLIPNLINIPTPLTPNKNHLIILQLPPPLDRIYLPLIITLQIFPFRKLYSTLKINQNQSNRLSLTKLNECIDNGLTHF